MKPGSLFLALFVVGGPLMAGSHALQLPDREPVELQPSARIQFDPINESSGIVASRTHDDVFWTHNDSGDDPRIFAIRRDGSPIIPQWARQTEGILIGDAQNVDWEDIAIDGAGNLWIGAFGNNGNARKDLAVYRLPEPVPGEVLAARALERIDFYYPDQVTFPATGKDKNFDCEGFFSADGELYFLSKHRGDKTTKLYRLEHDAGDGRLPLRLLEPFDIQGSVTAADATPDGNRIAILTYGAIWVFDRDRPGPHWFDGTVRWLPIKARQCEAIAFIDAETLIITNEQRDIFEVAVTDLVKVAR